MNRTIAYLKERKIYMISVVFEKLSIRVGKAVIEIEKDYDEELLQNVIRSLEAIC